MRYLLDTNILVYLITGEHQELCPEVEDILFDYSSVLSTSSISVVELMQLVRLGKIKHKEYKTGLDYIKAIKDLAIEIKPYTADHTKTLAKLTAAENHNDPMDHSIISHAIAEKLTLVSSDRKFDFYTNQNLKFIFNKR